MKGVFIFLQEAFSSLRQNKTRSILAGFGVAWGIFILIILLGFGRGFQEGILGLFGFYAQKSIWVYGGERSESNNAYSTGEKKVLFTYDDNKILKKRFPDIELISPELDLGYPLVINKQNTGYYQLKGVLTDYFHIKLIKPEKGRVLNVSDNKECRRVTLIGKQVADELFPHDNIPIGQFINVGGLFFKVVGIIEKGSIFTQGEQNIIYIPYNTYLDCYNQGKEFNTFMLTLKGTTNTTDFENHLKVYLSRKYRFDIHDSRAIYIINFEKQVKDFEKLFKGIDMFLWFIGLCLLLSGIVGVSNIMFVIVKERTFEIGIRKAIGAKSSNILSMIIVESVVITSLAGLLGILCGSAFIFLLNWILTIYYCKGALISSIDINFPVIFLSLLMLILSGILAGFLPAKKAAKISPVEAIRYETR